MKQTVVPREFFRGQKVATPVEGSKAVVDGRELMWSAVHTNGSALDMGQVESAIVFGFVYVVCTQDMSGVVLSIGSDDSSMWKLNGDEVVSFYFVFHGPEDGGTNRHGWAAAERTPGLWEAGLRKVKISHSSSNTMWHYRVCATNGFGAAWAESSGPARRRSNCRSIPPPVGPAMPNPSS